MGTLGIPGAIISGPSSGGGGSGGSSLQALYIDDLATPASPSMITPNPQGGDVIAADGVWRFATILYTAGGAAVSNGADGEGEYVNYSPGGSNGQEAYIQGALAHTPSPGCHFWTKFRFFNADRSRLWLGYFASDVSGNALRTGDPASAHAALRFQNGDTNWQFISKLAGAQEITDTAVPPVNATVYYLRVSVTSGQVFFAIYDATMALIADATHTTEVPSDDAPLRPTLYSNNDGVNSARRLQFYSAHAIQTHLP